MSKDLMSVPGSLKSSGGDGGIEELFVSDVEAILLVDISGSMSAYMPGSDKTRWEAANEELGKAQASLPGRIALVEFSDNPRFKPQGVLDLPGGTTALHVALKYVQIADGFFKIIVVSDGEPNSIDDALAIAKTFKHPIDTIYIGPLGGKGEEFLKLLAQVTGGKSHENFETKALGEGLIKLLGGGKNG